MKLNGLRKPMIFAGQSLIVSGSAKPAKGGKVGKSSRGMSSKRAKSAALSSTSGKKPAPKKGRSR
jgi:hypothetical protein